MKKIIVLLLISMLASVTAFASTTWNGLYGNGYLWPSSFGAYADTEAGVSADYVEAKVTVAYLLNGNSNTVTNSERRYGDSVSTSVSVPSGAVPTKADGVNWITIPIGTFSGTTSYFY